MICRERKNLADKYRDSVDKFRDAVAALSNVKDAGFDRAYSESELLRMEVEQAKNALEWHRRAHRC
jgi:hypothetical protein